MISSVRFTDFPSQLIGSNSWVQLRIRAMTQEADVHSVWLQNFADVLVSRGFSRWCLAYCVELEQVSPNTIEVIRQQFSVSPTISRLFFLWRQSRDAEWTLDVAGERNGGNISRERRFQPLFMTDDGTANEQISKPPSPPQKKKKDKYFPHGNRRFPLVTATLTWRKDPTRRGFTGSIDRNEMPK